MGYNLTFTFLNFKKLKIQKKEERSKEKNTKI